MALVDRCLWATPSPLLSIIQALLPAQQRLLKPFRLKVGLPIGFFFLSLLVQMRSITKRHSLVSSLLCNIRSSLLNVDLLDQDIRGKRIRTLLTRIRSLFTERVKNNTKHKTHWLYTLRCALHEAQDPKDNPAPGRVPGYPRCIMFSFVIHIQTMSCG